MKRDQLTSIRATFLDVNHPMRAQLAAAAQRVYDDWQVDAEGLDWQVGSGGICHLIADVMQDVLSKYGVWSQSQSCSYEVHVNVLAQFREGIYVIDINPYDYETGGGYSWKKRPDIEFTPDFVTASKIDGDPFNLREYVEEYEGDADEEAAAAFGAPSVACGLCFEWAYLNLPDASNAKLVHAIVQPFGGKFGDRAYPHAWIERVGRVFDWQSVTQGYGPYGPRGWPRKKFYEIYQPIDIMKYDFTESRRMVARTRHMGPW